MTACALPRFFSLEPIFSAEEADAEDTLDLFDFFRQGLHRPLPIFFRALHITFSFRGGWEQRMFELGIDDEIILIGFDGPGLLDRTAADRGFLGAESGEAFEDGMSG